MALLGAHTDSPALRIKPVSKKFGENGSYIQVGVETYGGALSLLRKLVRAMTGISDFVQFRRAPSGSAGFVADDVQVDFGTPGSTATSPLPVVRWSRARTATSSAS